MRVPKLALLALGFAPLTQTSCSTSAPLVEVSLPNVSGSEPHQIHRLVNHYRVAQGRSELILDERLSKLARQHSAYMASTHHTRSGNFVLTHKGFIDRVSAAHGMGLTRLSENVAGVRGLGSGSIKGIVRTWVGSRGHRDNLLTPTRTHTGIGIARASDGSVYATQLFGVER